MEIILLEDVRRLGKRGEVVHVKPGFARNFLLPRGAALELGPKLGRFVFRVGVNGRGAGGLRLDVL